MKHISEIELLEYAAGNLAASDADRVARHIAECADCASRHEQARSTWEILGNWPVDPSAHGIADHLVNMAAADSVRPARTTAILSFRPRLLGLLRIAAAILVAIGAGHIVGRLTLPANQPTAIISTEKPRY